jgi:hypothetical protein
MSRGQVTLLEALGWFFAGLAIIYAIARFAYQYR